MKGKQSSKTGLLSKGNLGSQSKLRSKGNFESGKKEDSPEQNQKKSSIIVKEQKPSLSSSSLVNIEGGISDKNCEGAEQSFTEKNNRNLSNLDKISNDLKNADEDIKLDLEIPNIKPSENSNNIKVIARFRPLNKLEIDLQSRGMGGICVRYANKECCTVTNSVGFAQSYTFDRVFDTNTNQKSLFEEAAQPVIKDILLGYNGTIFTYGQSGSGKTHTMYGSSLYDEDLKGIIPRSIEYMFDYINDPKNEQTKFQIKFSMLEIYKEALYDLLNPQFNSKDLKIKETKDKQIYVTNLTEEYISSIDEFLLLIDQADKFRVVSETGLNKQSSRSHLLFIIEVLQQLPDGSEKCGKLNLIDLAGSEKITKTGAVGETLEEAKKINLSLSTLGMVISSLSSEKDYIPYRDSKLTRILQDSLGGNYKTTLVVACSPHIFNSEESNATLKFAMRAKKIKNKVKQNIKKSTEELEKIIDELSQKLGKAQAEISRLKSKLKDLPQNIKEQYKLQEEDCNDLKGGVEESLCSDDILNLQKNFCNKKQLSSPSVYRPESGKLQEDLSIGLKTKSVDLLGGRTKSMTTKLLNYEFNPDKIIEEKEDVSSTNSDNNESFLNIPIKRASSRTKVNDIIKVDLTEPNKIIPTFGCEDEPFVSNEEEDILSKRKSTTETQDVNKDNRGKKAHLDKEQANFINNQKIERLEELIVLMRKENEKLNSSKIFLKESNIQLKDQIKELCQSSENSNKLEILRVEKLLSSIEETTKSTLEKLNKVFDFSRSESNELLAVKQENTSLRTKIIKQEYDFLLIFRKLKLFENENFIEDLVTQSTNISSDYNSIFSKIDEVVDPMSLSFSHTLTFNKSFFKEILRFFTSKNEFFNNDIYNSTNDLIKDLDKAKSNNIKSAFIK